MSDQIATLNLKFKVVDNAQFRRLAEEAIRKHGGGISPVNADDDTLLTELLLHSNPDIKSYDEYGLELVGRAFNVCGYCREAPADTGYDRCTACRTWRDEEWCEANGVEHGVDPATVLTPHGTWTAVRRHPKEFVSAENASVDQQIEWFLEAITQSGDVNQRRYDLEQLADLIKENPGAGYGVLPIDHDVHGPECVICEGADSGPQIRDGHPYADRETEVWVVGWVYWNGDEQGGGGFNWWPIDEEAEAREGFEKEWRGWEAGPSPAIVRFYRLRVPDFITQDVDKERARQTLTDYIDADIDRIEGVEEPMYAKWLYGDHDSHAVLVRQAVHLRKLGHDCSADDSAFIKAWMRHYTPADADADPAVADVIQTFPNEWDETATEPSPEPVAFVVNEKPGMRFVGPFPTIAAAEGYIRSKTDAPDYTDQYSVEPVWADA